MAGEPVGAPRRSWSWARVPGIAIVVFLALQLWVNRPHTVTALVVQVLGIAVVPFLFGIFLGRSEWPRRGTQLARYLLRRRVRKGTRGIFLSDRPDVREGLPIRMVEVMGFSAGAAILLAAVLPLLGLASASVVLPLAIPLALVTLWGSFILVPYWVFGRMGLREVDARLWLVQPLGRNYASRLKLSNGALLLAAVGAVINLAFRAGASQEEALIDGIRTAVTLILVIFIAAITAVASYMSREGEDVRAMETEALDMGVTDGRGVSDADFLPRLPARAAVLKSQRS